MITLQDLHVPYFGWSLWPEADHDVADPLLGRGGGLDGERLVESWRVQAIRLSICTLPPNWQAPLEWVFD